MAKTQLTGFSKFLILTVLLGLFGFLVAIATVGFAVVSTNPFIVGFVNGICTVFYLIAQIFSKTSLISNEAISLLNNFWFSLGFIMGTAVSFLILKKILKRLFTPRITVTLTKTIS